jgi:hypothetical protein
VQSSYRNGKRTIRPHLGHATHRVDDDGFKKDGFESKPETHAVVIPQATVSRRRSRHHDSKSLVSIIPFTVILLCSILGLLFFRTEIWARPHTHGHLGDVELQQLVQRVIVQVSKDLIGRRDFALYSSGGSVVRVLTTGIQDANSTQARGQNPSESTTSVPQSSTSRTNLPEVALSDDLRMDNC